MARARSRQYCYDHPHPAVTADAAVFTIREGALAVLLIRRGQPPFRGRWALPGGFVGIDEDLEDAARRELEEETGVAGVELEQLASFGAPNRDPRERVITVVYYTLIPPDRARLRAASDAADAAWHPLSRLPRLAFDHEEIIAMAHARVRAGADDVRTALDLVPPEFTLTELQSVHEVIRGGAVDKRNFRKRLLALGAVEDTGRTRRDGAHRPARLYRATAAGALY